MPSRADGGVGRAGNAVFRLLQSRLVLDCGDMILLGHDSHLTESQRVSIADSDMRGIEAAQSSPARSPVYSFEGRQRLTAAE